MSLARTAGQALSAWVATLPVLFLSDSAMTADVAMATRKGLLRKVGPRLYTTDLETPVENLLRRNALLVASLRWPGCVLSHRTALEMRDADGVVFLTGPADKTERLSGLTIKVKRGPGPQEGDTEFLSLYTASRARAFLENLDYTRHGAGVPRVLTRAQIEERLDVYLRERGEDELNRLRDHARRLAPILGASAGFSSLDQIIGALLQTRPDVELETAVARARARGTPYDVARIALFERLVADLRQPKWRETLRPRGPLSRLELQHLALIEAYFSNFIEGTKFEIGEAREIVFDRRIPANRPADAHDILGTFELLVDESEMLVSAATFDAIDDFEHMLRRRHARIMSARPDKRPGEFKIIGNQAGNTTFVAPELVRETLARGFELFHELEMPFQRAAFMMFMIAEIHPFDDGNGRLARAMMSAELASEFENRIVIVTSYRPDYLGGLRRLSRAQDSGTYLRMLDHAHEFTARLEFEDLDALIATLESCNAFDDSELRIMKLPPRPETRR
jgi:hypothetical protein